jgi:hypothetical protein
MSGSAAWCGPALAAVLCCAALDARAQSEAQPPSVDSIQAAYDKAKLEAKERHDDQLLIREAECQSTKPNEFSCQVGFTDKRSSDGRLYFDVIGLDRERPGWKLVSGLCKR